MGNRRVPTGRGAHDSPEQQPENVGDEQAEPPVDGIQDLPMDSITTAQPVAVTLSRGEQERLRRKLKAKYH
jgi:hypothetical protein